MGGRHELMSVQRSGGTGRAAWSLKCNGDLQDEGGVQKTTNSRRYARQTADGRRRPLHRPDRSSMNRVDDDVRSTCVAHSSSAYVRGSLSIEAFLHLPREVQ